MWKNIKWVIKNIVIGLVMIYVVNILGIHYNIFIPVNVITIIIAGFLRIPGLVILLVVGKI